MQVVPRSSLWNRGSVLILLLSAQLSYGQKTVKSMLRPPVGKLDTKNCPVLHIDQPSFPLTLDTISGVLGSAFKAGDRLRPIAYKVGNEVYLPEGTYDVVFGGGRYYIGTPIPCPGGGSCQSIVSKPGETFNDVSLDAPMDQLQLRVEAKNGHHYYLFAPIQSVVPKTAAVEYAPPPGRLEFRSHMYGVLKVCGLSSDRILTPEEERNGQQLSSVTCDTLTAPHAKEKGQAPPVVRPSSSR